MEVRFLVFAHLPKTAGTSVTAVLAKYLQANGFSDAACLLYGTKIPYDDLRPLEQLPGSVRMVAGHFSSAHYDKLLPHRPFVLSSHRDPFERFCSWLEHVHRFVNEKSEGEREALSSSLQLLHECRKAGTDRVAMRDALRRYHDSSEGSGRHPHHILMHQQEFVADARIDPSEIKRLVEYLAALSSKPRTTLRELQGVMRKNIWKRAYFQHFNAQQSQLLHDSFTVCFADEISLSHEFCRQVPSLFAKDVWPQFAEALLPASQGGHSVNIASRLCRKLATAGSGDWQSRKPSAFSGVAQMEKRQGSLFARIAGRGQSLFKGTQAVSKSAVPSRDKRILWLLNHTTLMEWEVPMLEKLGFEVFVPKCLPMGPNSRTARVTNRFDVSLTIPADELEFLNSVNFYDEPLSARAVSVINRRFKTAIAASVFPGLYYLLRGFSGQIFMRAFGHAGEFDYESATATILAESLDHHSYSPVGARVGRLWSRVQSRLPTGQRIQHHNAVTTEMYRVRHRLYLAAAYEEIIAHERPFLKNRAVFLPLALPQAMVDAGGGWTGGEDRVLFICPNIDQIDYYRRIYVAFKEQLGDIPHWIAGRQDLDGVQTAATTDDPSVLGYVPRERLDELLRRCVCMFYHSREPRHLHYHPLEAIATGHPLVFLSGGLLESLGGRDQPGCCQDYAEAREKIQRLRQGDDVLRRSIQDAQRAILEPFKPSFCEAVWRQNFLPLVQS